MDKEKKSKKEERFLDKYIYKGLTNLNDGFDVPSIKYFSKKDFIILLGRAERYKISIYGIEPWDNREYSGCETFESYNTTANDPEWYWKAFSKFCDEGIKSYFSASYGIPEDVLNKYIKEIL
jgi:hypothetical protein